MQRKIPQSTDACNVFMKNILAKKEGMLTHVTKSIVFHKLDQQKQAVLVIQYLVSKLTRHMIDKFAQT